MENPKNNTTAATYGNHDFQLIFMRNKKEFLTVSLSDRFAERLICQHPLRILPHLCKGVARSKEFFLFLFADALFIPTCRDEIHGIFAEDTISETISVFQREARSFVFQRSGLSVFRHSHFAAGLAMVSRIAVSAWIFCMR